MKTRIIALFILGCLLAGCSKTSPDRLAQDFTVRIYHQESSGAPQQPATSVTVLLFEDTGRQVDNAASVESVRQSGVMTYADGSVSALGRSGQGASAGVRLYERISNGRYILWVVYNVRNLDYMASSLPVTVDDDIQGRTLGKVFLGSSPGYQDWTASW